MKNLLYLIQLLALKKDSTTWFIDGSNMLSHKGTPADRPTLVDKLQPIQGVDVVLVFDGNSSCGPNLPKRVNVHGNIETVQLSSSSSSSDDDDDLSADDYILQQINSWDTNRRGKIQVVTADRELRSRVLEHRGTGVVNPVTFWKRYLPRLGGLKTKKDSSPQPFQ